MKLALVLVMFISSSAFAEIIANQSTYTLPVQKAVIAQESDVTDDDSDLSGALTEEDYRLSLQQIQYHYYDSPNGRMIGAPRPPDGGPGTVWGRCTSAVISRTPVSGWYPTRRGVWRNPSYAIESDGAGGWRCGKVPGY